MLPLNEIEKKMKAVCIDYMKGEDKIMSPKYYRVGIYGNGYKLKEYYGIIADNETEAKETALRYAPDDIAYNTYNHYKEITAKILKIEGG